MNGLSGNQSLFVAWLGIDFLTGKSEIMTRCTQCLFLALTNGMIMLTCVLGPVVWGQFSCFT